jgi:membrane-associated protease RseP (regulator of RpoE activity)
MTEENSLKPVTSSGMPSARPAEDPVPGLRKRRPSFFDKDRTWLNIILFLLTLLSTYMMGLTTWSLSYVYADAALEANDMLEIGFEVLADPQVIMLSFFYMFALIGILLAHEMGHYLTCRFYGLNATLPFFIPLPNLIGTMGAFIRIRSPITRKHQLFDVGVAGPLAGFILTVPAAAYGLAHSKLVPAMPSDGAIFFGEPLLFKILGSWLLGDIPPGYDIVLHPVAFAGWVGALVTAMNLFPIGQLDGGHVMYAIFGSRVKKWAPWILGAFVLMGIFLFAGWLLWAVLIGFLGLRHPPVWDEHVPLDGRRRLVGYAVIVIFILSFIPDPIKGAGVLDIIRQFLAGSPVP